LSELSSESPVNAALRQFEAAEANLEKLERIFEETRDLIPDGICFGSDPKYDDRCRAFSDVLDALPMIDGWKPENRLLDLNEIAQWRLEAREIDEISAMVSVEECIDPPGRDLAEYRHRLSKKRRQLIRDALCDIIGSVDETVRVFRCQYPEDASGADHVEGEEWQKLKAHVKEIETLLGSSLPRPARWGDLRRHLHFGQVGDLWDILDLDWPKVKAGLSEALYDQNEAIPVSVEDLGAVAAAHPRGPVATRLNWTSLNAEDFERLVFALISGARGYENPEWLMKTSAPDRGRDLSVTRIANDPLGGVIRSRVIIQCKHWPNKSVSASDVAGLKEQMTHWEPPRVDVLVIATTGRFSSDAVSLIERHNNADRALRIEMWPESHLERLLAERPALIAEFGLR